MHGRAATAVSVSVNTSKALSSDPNRDKLVLQRQQASTSASKDHSSLPQNQQARMKIRTRMKNDVSPPFAAGPSKASLKSSYHTKSVNSVQQTQDYLTGGIVNQNLSANQKLTK